MELLANELSVAGQFHVVARFHEALSGLMSLRKVARVFDREVRVRHDFAQIEPIPGVPLRRAVQGMGSDQVRAVMQWLDRAGPFWDNERRHGADDWLECGEEVVTDTAVGEAAYRVSEGEACGLISVRAGEWNRSPLPVTYRSAEETTPLRRVEVENWRQPDKLRRSLEALDLPVDSWVELEARAIGRYSMLRFSNDCFDALRGVPFQRSSAERILTLLQLLHRLASAFDQDGHRTAEGHRIYARHFTGDRAPFSDSSDSDKAQFGNELTFPHPDAPGETLTCPWHGKERHLLLRLHFSWPVRAGEPVYVVYVGRKLTTR